MHVSYYSNWRTTGLWQSPNAVGWKNTSLVFQQWNRLRKEPQRDQPVSISPHCSAFIDPQNQTQFHHSWVNTHRTAGDWLCPPWLEQRSRYLAHMPLFVKPLSSTTRNIGHYRLVTLNHSTRSFKNDKTFIGLWSLQFHNHSVSVGF